ncbi:class I SAM-dependent methyltransferase [Pseudokineococcus basanitobsidens]|uniref:Class I SAM-dependent methyltransferase n=1 Tax=Pseudokineococcus basanitobsidens TaxID=1926649 RepID=A0ABU8RMF1_9ACTN
MSPVPDDDRSTSTTALPPEPLDEAARRARRGVFDAGAARYAAARPTYPDGLFDALAAYGVLGPGARVLEVAPGTGQATRPMGLRGWWVHAVELGGGMAAAARAHVADLPRVTVEVTAFEDWPLPDDPFDAVVCCTAWHWLDPSVRVGKAARALRPGGTLAVVWTHHVAGGPSSADDEVTAAYAAAGLQTAWSARRPREEDLTPSTAELAGSPYLGDVRSVTFPVETAYHAGALVELFGTYSEVVALSPARRERLLTHLAELVDARGGLVTRRHVVELVLARPTAPDDGSSTG